MTEHRYIVMTLEDAKEVACAVSWFGALRSRAVAKFVERMRVETGADMEDIVNELRGLRTGRRLRRLLERARGERGPGPVEEPRS